MAGETWDDQGAGLAVDKFLAWRSDRKCKFMLREDSLGRGRCSGDYMMPQFGQTSWVMIGLCRSTEFVMAKLHWFLPMVPTTRFIQIHSGDFLFSLRRWYFVCSKPFAAAYVFYEWFKSFYVNWEHKPLKTDDLSSDYSEGETIMPYILKIFNFLLKCRINF